MGRIVLAYPYRTTVELYHKLNKTHLFLRCLSQSVKQYLESIAFCNLFLKSQPICRQALISKRAWFLWLLLRFWQWIAMKINSIIYGKYNYKLPEYSSFVVLISWYYHLSIRSKEGIKNPLRFAIYEISLLWYKWFHQLPNTINYFKIIGGVQE